MCKLTLPTYCSIKKLLPVMLTCRYDFRYGGAYNLYLQQTGEDEYRLDIVIVTPPNSIHMLWLMPQYIVLTAGEVLFSITSLAFAFTQVREECM